MKTGYFASIYLVAIFLLTQAALLNAQTSSMNYIRTTELMTAVTNPNSINGIPNQSNAKRTTITYFDGLGRPIQEVIVAKSPGSNDIIQHIEYDAIGRTTKQYLPFTAASQYGSYYSSPQTGLQQFYNGNEQGVPATAVYFAQTEYEPSPLNRVVRTSSPGEVWAIDNGHQVNFNYATNLSNEVIRFNIDGDNITNTSFYDASTLFKNTTTDEDGQQSMTYTDLEGRVVLKRSNLGSDNFADTYYVYNDLGLLIAVLMPEANKLTGTFTDWKNAFQYKYDGRKRMVRRQIPGADSICYVYNKANLIIAEQDGNMRKQKKWKFYKFDGLQRTILEGFIYSSELSRVQLQDEADKDTYDVFEVKQVGYFDYFLGYSNNAFPTITGGSNIQQAFFYDDYLFKDNNLNSVYDDYYQTGDFSDAAVRFTKGKLTGKIDKSSMSREVFYYDEYGRMVQKALNISTGFLYEGHKYSFSGHLTLSNKRFIYSTNPPFNYSFSYFYDYNWRPSHTILTIGGNSQQINALEYNELSQLEYKYLHGSSNNYLQRQSFDYNIRGWLTAIGSMIQDSPDAFAQKLYYDKVPTGTASKATPRFNGNICATEWRVDGITPSEYKSGYLYSYDSLNRLTAANYYKRNIISSAIEWEGMASSDKGSWGLITGIGTVREIKYDDNGNIQQLSRLARRASDSDIILFDSLSYAYDGNTLKSVYDAISGQNSLGDYPGGSGLAATFNYDMNGNMTFDPVRGLRLDYNQMNMPKIIQHDQGRVENTYSWDGRKLRRRVLDQYEQLLSDERYFGDLVTEYGLPLRILHNDGYVDVNELPMFNYHLKDHLGNVRSVLQSMVGPDNGSIVQVSDYYPFGMAYTLEYREIKDGENQSTVSIDERGETYESRTFTRTNPYLYNSKEEQPMPGKWLDYGARFYDPQLGRFHTVDPLADFTPSINPYHYCYNNPVRFVDPTGMMAEQSTYIASTYVDDKGTVLYHVDDGDPRVYLVTDPEAWVKGGRKKDGLSVVGYEDPRKDYKPGDQYTFYAPCEDPEYAGTGSKDPDEYWEAHNRYYYDLGYYDEEGNPLYGLYGNPVAGYYPDGPMNYMAVLALANVRYAPQWYMAGSEPTWWGEAIVGTSAILYGTWIWYDSYSEHKKGKNWQKHSDPRSGGDPEKGRYGKERNNNRGDKNRKYIPKKNPNKR